jgi:hypothetical protein
MALAITFFPWLLSLTIGFALLLAVILTVAKDLTVWQNLTFFILVGYSALNYGFANWSLRFGGMPIPIGHFLAFSALFLALPKGAQHLPAFFRTPIAVLWLMLVSLSLFHLIYDVPKHGGYAVRDASFVAEGIFLMVGFLWARHKDHGTVFLKVMSCLFLLTFIYALMYPARAVLSEYSPVSGIFLEVPLLGFFNNISFWLITGALFYLLVAKYIVRLPSLVLLILALLQAAWSAIFQDRSAYLGVILSLLLLSLFGRTRKMFTVLTCFVVAMIVLFFVIGIFDVVPEGRLGPVEPEFFIRHFRSFFLDPHAPGTGTTMWRLSLLRDMWARWTDNPGTILIGEGFGEPLTGIHKKLTGVTVRQPHNTHLTILVRLGAVGFFLWVLLHWKIVALFLRSLRSSRQRPRDKNIILWFFLFYILGIMLTSVQPWLEFSYGAIPFFTIMGFAIGLLYENTGHTQLLSPARR